MPRKGQSRVGLYAAIAVVVVVVVVLAGGYAAGWFKSSSTTNTGTCNVPSGQTIDGAGSTLVAPLMVAWSLAYTASTYNYASVGSGAGITDITEKTVSIGASDAPMNPAQRAALPGSVLTIPESAGGVVPIYNLPISTTLKFTGQILAEIYLGAITNWNNSQLQAVNVGVTLPNAAIYVVHRSDGSGTTFAWSSYLSLENATWKADYGHSTVINWPVGHGSPGNAGVTTTVKGTPDAIGYVDINYALTNGVAFGAVQNPTGNYIVANVTNIASAIADSNVQFPSPSGDWYNVTVENAMGAHDYPISTLTYVFIYADGGKTYGSSFTQSQAQALVDLLAWMVSPTGQSYAAPLYYIPLVASTAAFDLSEINSATYNGAALTACAPS
ncbi:MAG: phosphate ABC transporter substrate-binding protein PstS [Thermoplasmata archaeon]